jgi:hypothetical protein
MASGEISEAVFFGGSIVLAIPIRIEAELPI